MAGDLKIDPEINEEENHPNQTYMTLGSQLCHFPGCIWVVLSDEQ